VQPHLHLGKVTLSLLGGRKTARHQINSIEGWTVLVNERLLEEEKEAKAKALGFLRAQLLKIARVVPAAAPRRNAVPILRSGRATM
jgi:hypothetical protein